MDVHVFILMSMLLPIFNPFKLIVIFNRKPHSLAEKQVTENNNICSQCFTEMRFGFIIAVLTILLLDNFNSLIVGRTSILYSRSVYQVHCIHEFM
jgi:hypothetical protein